MPNNKRTESEKKTFTENVAKEKEAKQKAKENEEFLKWLFSSEDSTNVKKPKTDNLSPALKFLIEDDNEEADASNPMADGIVSWLFSDTDEDKDPDSNVSKFASKSLNDKKSPGAARAEILKKKQTSSIKSDAKVSAEIKENSKTSKQQSSENDKKENTKEMTNIEEDMDDEVETKNKKVKEASSQSKNEGELSIKMQKSEGSENQEKREKRVEQEGQEEQEKQEKQIDWYGNTNAKSKRDSQSQNKILSWLLSDEDDSEQFFAEEETKKSKYEHSEVNTPKDHEGLKLVDTKNANEAEDDEAEDTLENSISPLKFQDDNSTEEYNFRISAANTPAISTDDIVLSSNDGELDTKHFSMNREFEVLRGKLEKSDSAIASKPTIEINSEKATTSNIGDTSERQAESQVTTLSPKSLENPVLRSNADINELNYSKISNTEEFSTTSTYDEQSEAQISPDTLNFAETEANSAETEAKNNKMRFKTRASYFVVALLFTAVGLFLGMFLFSSSLPSQISDNTHSTQQNVANLDNQNIKYIAAVPLAFGPTLLLNPDDITAEGKQFLAHNIAQDLVAGLFSKFVKKGDKIINIGYDNGYYALYASKILGKSGMLYDFESDKSVYKNFKASIAMNAISNIGVYNINFTNLQTNCQINSLDGGSFGTIKIEQNSNGGHKCHQIDQLFASKQINFMRIENGENTGAIALGSLKTAQANPKIKILLQWSGKSHSTENDLIAVIKAYSDLGFSFWHAANSPVDLHKTNNKLSETQGASYLLPLNSPADYVLSDKSILLITKKE